MVKLLDLYLGRAVLSATGLVMFIILVLRTFFMYMDELKDVGKGSYSSVDALFYVFLSMPSLLYEYFPICVLIGGLLGLGMLASSSELLVMRAAGFSTYRIVYAVMKSTLLLMLIVVIIGEWIAPAASKYAQQLRTVQISKGQLIKSKSGIWLKEGSDFIHVENIYADGTVTGLSIIRLKDDFSLQSVHRAQTGSYLGEKKQWELKNVAVTHFADEQVKSTHLERLLWSIEFLSPGNVDVVGLHPDDLNVRGLLAYKRYLEENGLKSNAYELAFWNKLLMPFSTAVMMYLALSFIFGPLRSSTMGAKILLGVIMGFAFHLTGKVFGNLSHEIPPLVSALVPLGIFGTAAFLLMRRAG